jgi:hypothetical protein
MRSRRRRNALLVTGLVSTLSLTSLAGPAVASGSAISISAVEGQAFSGAVANYTSDVTANQRFVAQAYLDILGRRPSSTDLAFFDTLLGSGGTRAGVAAALLASDEYRAALAASIYDAYLHRTPTSTELAVAVTLLAGGATDEEARASVLGSAEYFENRGNSTVDGLLHALFLDVLGRPIDSGSEAFYLALAATATRTEIALDVLTSSESRARLVTGLFEQFLHRSPSPTDLQTFVLALQSGATVEDVIADLVGSDEYLSNVPASFASATIDWGDSTPTSPGTSTGGAVSGSHTYADEGSHTVTVTVDDLDGTFTFMSSAVVSDAALSATPASFSVLKRTTFTAAVATFTDANPAADVGDFTASIDWGDGQVTTGAISAQPLGGFAVEGSHSYKSKGDYAVAVHVQDVGGSTATAVGNATVTNKSGR